MGFALPPYLFLYTSFIESRYAAAMYWVEVGYDWPKID